MTVIVYCPTCDAEILCGVDIVDMPGFRGPEWDGDMTKPCVCPTPSDDEINEAVVIAFTESAVRE